MNLLLWIFTILFCLALTDFVTDRYPRLQNQIYHIAFMTTYILFTIKYYYGPDIVHYVPFYETIQQPKDILNGNYNGIFEIGYAFFCSVIKQIGISFWGMTAIISTIYFIAIYMLFKQIPKRKTFALLILVILDHILIFSTYRQCLAVSCFIFMVLSFWKKKILLSMIWCVISVTLHKSAIFISIPALLLLNITSIKVDRHIYSALILILIAMLAIPASDSASAIIRLLPLDNETIRSITHHLSLARNIQMIFIIYLLYMIAIVYYRSIRYTNTVTEKHFRWIILAGALIIVALYQYYYILNRIRSYLLPFLITYIFIIVNERKSILCGASANIRSAANIIRQTAILATLVYCVHFSISLYKSQKNLKGNVYATSTILELHNHSEEYLKKRQIRTAQIYWAYDFMHNNNNKIQQ